MKGELKMGRKAEIYREAYLMLPRRLSPIEIVWDFICQGLKEGIITKDSRILSQGCEVGTWEKVIFEESSPHWYQSVLPRITGIDIDLGFLREAKELMPVVASDVRNLSFPSHCFDLSYSPLVLQWLSPEDRARAVQETARVLKKGGRALFIVPGPKHLEPDLSNFPFYSLIPFKEVERMIKEFLISKRTLRSYAKGIRDFKVISLSEIKEHFVTFSPEQRIALIYADTLVPSVSHNKEHYINLIRSLIPLPTRIHWVVMVCKKK